MLSAPLTSRAITVSSETAIDLQLGADNNAETVSGSVAVVNGAEADLAETRERHGSCYELVDRLWLHEWGSAEKREYLARAVRSCEVSKGRGPLSGRVEVELR
jgi:hypothetical protein